MVEEKGGKTMPEPDLLVTKFTIPPVRSALLHRSHLLEVLDQSRLVPFWRAGHKRQADRDGESQWRQGTSAASLASRSVTLFRLPRKTSHLLFSEEPTYVCILPLHHL